MPSLRTSVHRLRWLAPFMVNIVFAGILIGAPKPGAPQFGDKNFPDEKHVTDKGPVSWMDAPLKSWNRPGRSLPRARATVDENCQKDSYKAASAEERAVAKAGWFVIRKSVNRGGISIVTGETTNDGMCRPWGFQNFVFVNGVYAGTLSPLNMNARTDGAGYDVSIPEEGKIAVEFLRYTEKDSMCCASRISRVEYEVRQENGKPVVVATTVKTRRAQ